MGKRVNISIDIDDSNNRIDSVLELDITNSFRSRLKLIKFIEAAAANLVKVAYNTAASKPYQVLFGGDPSVATLTLTGLPVAAETFTLNGIVFTAIATGAVGNQFNIGANATATAANIAAAINASASPIVKDCVKATSVAGVVTITSIRGGIDTTLYTLAEALTNATAVTFAGGTHYKEYRF